MPFLQWTIIELKASTRPGCENVLIFNTNLSYIMNPNIWIIWLTKSFVNFREEINKAYRKLAVLLHPDKSVAPGSEEAFKLLVAARTALLKSVQSWWIHSPNTRIDLHLDRPIFGSVQSWWLHSPNTRTDLHLGVSSLDDCIHQIPGQTYTWECPVLMIAFTKYLESPTQECPVLMIAFIKYQESPTQECPVLMNTLTKY